MVSEMQANSRKRQLKREIGVPDEHFTLTLAEISEAPVRQGEEYGPCLLGHDEDPHYEWSLGRWNGEGWFDSDGARLRPVVWCRLPPLSRALAGARNRSRAGNRAD